MKAGARSKRHNPLVAVRLGQPPGAEDKGHRGSRGEAMCRAQMEVAKNGKQQAEAGRQGEAEIGGGSE